jgi:hypothetical protein
MEGECVEQLVWRGHDWGGTRGLPPLAQRIGRTQTRACGKPARPVTIYAIRGVDPAIGIAVQPRGEHRWVGVAAGYIAESPRHPLHDLLFGAGEPDEYADMVCRASRRLRARVRTAPVHGGRPLTVDAERPADRRYLRANDMHGELSFDRHSVIEGSDRGGAPYVGRGDRVQLVLRSCVYGPQADDGLRGLHKLIVVRLTGGGSRR